MTRYNAYRTYLLRLQKAQLKAKENDNNHNPAFLSKPTPTPIKRQGWKTVMMRESVIKSLEKLRLKMEDPTVGLSAVVERLIARAGDIDMGPQG